MASDTSDQFQYKRGNLSVIDWLIQCDMWAVFVFNFYLFIFGYLTTISISEKVGSNGAMREPPLVSMEVISRHLPGATEENWRNPQLGICSEL